MDLIETESRDSLNFSILKFPPGDDRTIRNLMYYQSNINLIFSIEQLWFLVELLILYKIFYL